MAPPLCTPSVRHRALLLLAAAALITTAAAARQPMDDAHTISEQQTTTPFISPNQRPLLTYFFDANTPEVQLLPASAAHGPARPGRTPLRVKLSGAAAVSAFMPVISPRPTGMTHEVMKTWSALKNYALMFARVDAINKQATGNSPRLFPLPGIAVTAAADTPAATTDIGAFIDAAEAHGQRDAWTETSPGSVLLMPFGQSVAAVADIMHIAYDEAADAITLDLDLVHDPEMVSEFDHHGKQTLDAKTSHYHLATPAGVKVDAAGLLKALRESDYKLAGLHVFVKGNSDRACVTAASQGDGTFRVTARLKVSAENSNCPQNTGNSLTSCTNIVFSWTGDADEVGTSSCDPARQDAKAVPGTRRAGSGTATAGSYADTLDSYAWVDLRPRGDVAVKVDDVGYTWQSNVVTITGTVAVVGVSKLLLAPAKAHRHVHERVALTIQALGDDNTGVAGVPVALAAEGDCDPDMVTTTTTTDTNGRAVAYVTAHEPGALAVVAAATSASGAKLVTPPAHIIFFGDHEYVEHKEHHYYSGGEGRDPTYGTTEAYPEQAQPAEVDSDAARFAAQATKQALAQLPAA